MKERKSVEEFLQQTEVFPFARGLVVSADPGTGAEVEIQGLPISAECPVSQMQGLDVGDDGLFFVESCSDDGKAIVSYKKAIEFEALYSAAVANEVRYLNVGPITEPDLTEGLAGWGASFTEAVLRDVVAWIPEWAATGVDLSNQEEKIVVSVAGISVHEEQLVALLSRNRAIGMESFSHDSASVTHDPGQLKQYQAFLTKGNFVMGSVKEISEQGATIEFEFGITGLLSSQELQEGEVLEPNQSVGVLIKDVSEATGLLLTRRPLAVLNDSIWE